MRNGFRFCRKMICCCAILATVAAPSARAAYILTTLVTFDGVTNGAYPNGGLISDANGNLYGTTINGPSKPNFPGTVFELPKGSRTVETLATFGSSGQTTQSGVISDSSGNLYGTAFNGQRIVYEVPKGTNNRIPLASFDADDTPIAGVIMDASGNLYGVASGVNTGSQNIVYEIVKGSGVATTLVTFNGIDGADPNSLIFDSAGNLLGTTAAGGTYGYGTVFEIPAGTTNLTDLFTFEDYNGNGVQPGLILDSADNIFGTTGPSTDPGRFGYGTIFELSPPTVPEPGSLAMLGAIGVLASRRRFSRWS